MDRSPDQLLVASLVAMVHFVTLHVQGQSSKYLVHQKKETLCSTGWNWRLELEWCERKILLGWLELEAGVV